VDLDEVGAIRTPVSKGWNQRAPGAQREDCGPNGRPCWPTEEGYEHAGTASNVLIDEEGDHPIVGQGPNESPSRPTVSVDHLGAESSAQAGGYVVDAWIVETADDDRGRNTETLEA